MDGQAGGGGGASQEMKSRVHPVTMSRGPRGPGPASTNQVTPPSGAGRGRGAPTTRGRDALLVEEVLRR